MKKWRTPSSGGLDGIKERNLFPATRFTKLVVPAGRDLATTKILIIDDKRDVIDLLSSI